MKSASIVIIFVAVLIGGIIIFIGGKSTTNDVFTKNNVSIVNGKQIIEIDARGGYLPRSTLAKANMPTVLKVTTKGTFDCSAAIAMPSIGYRKNLPPSGETLIDIPPQKTGDILQGTCAMGMYNFLLRFE